MQCLCEIGEAYTGFWWENLRERDHLGDPGRNGRIILRWIFRTWDVAFGLERAGSGFEQVAGICDCGNELSALIFRGPYIVMYSYNKTN